MHAPRIFISYSHRGKGPEWKAKLLRAVHVFERHHLLDVWQDGKIRVSSFWDDDIKQAMSNSRIAVVLLTKEALESEYIIKTEFPFLREQQKGGKLTVFPVVCEKCDWRAHDWLRAIQGPNESNPLSQLSEKAQDSIFRQLATSIAEELSRIALQENSAFHVPHREGDVRLYLDKFPLTRGTGLREEKLIGREQELALLDLAFAQPHTAIVSLVAWGGVGKTMLVQHWLHRLQSERWSGARRAYAWSFYSQGTKEDRQASEDTFLAHALEWFGVQCEPTLSPWDKGRLLADAVSRERTLLILDGIEPLQYPPGPMGGQLRAPGVQILLKSLARKSSSLNSQPSTINQALCLVTTREPLTDLADFQRREGSPWGSVLRVDLGNLIEEAGTALLHHAGAKRAGAAEIKADDSELFAASREVDGHALTLNLLGRFLARAHGGDIRRRDLVKFEEADRKEQGGTTFKMLAAFENWFAKSGEFGARQLAVLRMLGLFDRPADAGCIGELRKPPLIDGLTDPLFTTRLDVNTGQATAQPLLEEDWNTVISFLADFGLIDSQFEEWPHTFGYGENEAKQVWDKAQRWRRHELGQAKPFQSANLTPGVRHFLDTHALIHEFFGGRLRETDSSAWNKAHSRLFDHLRFDVPYWPEGLDGLQPLYQAVTHGCHAARYDEALETFDKRVLRGSFGPQANYSTFEVSAFGADLSAISSFFTSPWAQPRESLRDDDQAWLRNHASFCLRALGRITEAREPMQVAMEVCLGKSDWTNAAIDASNLSEIDLSLGDVASALREAEQSVTLADRSGDIHRLVARACLANALDKAGRSSEALDCYEEAEALQREFQPHSPLLYSSRGFHFCDHLLGDAERTAWQRIMLVATDSMESSFALTQCNSVERRAAQTLDWAVNHFKLGLCSIVVDKLTVGRTKLFRGILESSRSFIHEAKTEIDAAVHGLLRVGILDYVPTGLITRAWQCFLEGDAVGARADLDEAWDIAERGPMRLHLADIHLHRARLFFREQPYPWKSPQADLAAAEKLINDCGYHRRDQELADAKRAILGA